MDPQYDFTGKLIKIRNTRIYGLEESILASSYPMLDKTPEADAFSGKVQELAHQENTGKDAGRAEKLGRALAGSGHDCFLKGIVVQADMSLPQYQWQQIKRYHWFDFVSSQSTMHRITRMSITDNCNAYVDPRIIALLEEKIAAYHAETDPLKKAEQFQHIAANIPSGFLLTARITTNYLQLKTMVSQRAHHKLAEWQEYCTWCNRLPRFGSLTSKG